MKLIVGLGNPGRVYANNRHNIGFVCVNYFARTEGIKFDQKKGRARIGIGRVAGNEVVLAKPQTYVNLSGESVSQLVKKFNININDLLIIHDDLDLPLAKMRISYGSSSGGHKGVESIITELGSHDFVRLRVGIGRPTKPVLSEAEIIAYVLSDFTAEQRQTINQVIPKVSEAILCLLTEGLTPAMNRYNRDY
jgi:PTH1 family peptidyl-tRNA hydrolase